jgi:PAS domain S-box-containing protein
VESFFGVGIDITERRQAAEQLAGSEKKFRSIFENAQDGIFLVRDDGTIIDVNPRVQEIFGWTRDEVLNLKPWDFSPPRQPDGHSSEKAVLKRIKMVLQGRPQLLEWVHTRKDNSRIETEINLNLIEIEGKPAVLAITRDISERKRMAETLRRTREAERTRIARELHDAVSQTLSSAGLIADVLPRLWQRDKSEGLKRLHELASLTRDAQSEMRSLLYELYPAALTNKSCGELLRQLAKTVDNRITVTIDVKAEKGCFLEAESEAECKYAIYRITQEAIHNIAKHAMAEHVWITLSCRANQVRLRITDDGVGFDTKSISQTSFGIRNMRERAKAVGGQLRIKSAVGKGTEIAFRYKPVAGVSR